MACPPAVVTAVLVCWVTPRLRRRLLPVASGLLLELSTLKLRRGFSRRLGRLVGAGRENVSIIEDLMEGLRSDIDYLTRAIENDKWPILLRGEWIDKDKCLDILQDAENNLQGTGEE